MKVMVVLAIIVLCGTAVMVPVLGPLLLELMALTMRMQ